MGAAPASRSGPSHPGSYGDLLGDADAGGGDEDEDEAPDGDVLGDADADGDEDVRTDGEAVTVGDVDVPTDGDAADVGDWYVPTNDGVLAGEDTAWGADGLADAPGDVCLAGVAAADEDVCAVGWSVTGTADCPVNEVRAKAVAPDTTRSAPMIHASTIGRHTRRRGLSCRADGRGQRSSAGGGGTLTLGHGMLPEVAVSELPALVWGRLSLVARAAELAAVVCVTGPGGTSAEPDGVTRAKVRVSESGSQLPPGWRAPTSASRPPAVGRWPGSLARQRPISGRTAGGTRSRLGVPWATRYSNAAVVPVPNGPSPVAANASTAPRLKMSLGGPTLFPMACSGDINPGDPTTRPVWVRAVASAAAREIPKSMTRGPSSASSTLDGFRSRCTTPAAWIALRLSASPAASASSDATGNGPWLSIASASEGPGT
jgi:hypothetical protein